MNKIIKFLDGKKTYILAVILAIYGLTKAFGLELTPEQDKAILTLIFALMGMSFRSAINKNAK